MHAGCLRDRVDLLAAGEDVIERAGVLSASVASETFASVSCSARRSAHTVRRVLDTFVGVAIGPNLDRFGRVRWLIGPFFGASEKNRECVRYRDRLIASKRASHMTANQPASCRQHADNAPSPIAAFFAHVLPQADVIASFLS
jgi:hypothetical protein